MASSVWEKWMPALTAAAPKSATTPEEEALRASAMTYRTGLINPIQTGSATGYPSPGTWQSVVQQGHVAKKPQASVTVRPGIGMVIRLDIPTPYGNYAPLEITITADMILQTMMTPGTPEE